MLIAMGLSVAAVALGVGLISSTGVLGSFFGGGEGSGGGSGGSGGEGGSGSGSGSGG